MLKHWGWPTRISDGYREQTGARLPGRPPGRPSFFENSVLKRPPTALSSTLSALKHWGWPVCSSILFDSGIDINIQGEGAGEQGQGPTRWSGNGTTRWSGSGRPGQGTGRPGQGTGRPGQKTDDQVRERDDQVRKRTTRSGRGTTRSGRGTAGSINGRQGQ